VFVYYELSLDNLGAGLLHVVAANVLKIRLALLIWDCSEHSFSLRVLLCTAMLNRETPSTTLAAHADSLSICCDCTDHNYWTAPYVPPR
jgi:hypothetical protein